MKFKPIAFWVAMISGFFTAVASIASLYNINYTGMEGINFFNLIDAALIFVLGYYSFKKSNFVCACVLSVYWLINVIFYSIPANQTFFPLVYLIVYILATYEIHQDIEKVKSESKTEK